MAMVSFKKFETIDIIIAHCYQSIVTLKDAFLVHLSTLQAELIYPLTANMRRIFYGWKPCPLLVVKLYKLIPIMLTNVS